MNTIGSGNMIKTNYRDESHLFGFLHKSLLRDFISVGWPPSVAGSLLRWFDPQLDDYLSHVDSWQKSLCAGIIQPNALPQAVLSYFKTDVVSDLPCIVVKEIHFIAKLFYKFHGNVRQPKGTCLESAKHRFAHPGFPIGIRNVEKRLRKVLTTLPAPDVEHLIGSYGPGTTSDGLDQFRRWCRDGVFPRHVPITAFIRDLNDYVAIGKIVYTRYGITKVAEVPKSIKSNRVVSAEYANFMWIQKAIGKALSKALHSRFKGSISLHDQAKHNRLLHQYGFRSIDLSDASDHVTRTLVWNVFPPQWRELLFQARSSFARFPDGTLVPLRTFAPMGSGFCFEVLTAIAASICACCCQHAWSVYGDDMIVHTDDFDYVVDTLTECGLVVNSAKCAQTLDYRESCGLELFHDMDITPIYIRDDWRKTTASKLEIISSFLEGLCFYATRDAILDDTECIIRRIRWNSALQRSECLVRTSCPPKTSQLPSEHGLFRWFCVKAEEQRVATDRRGMDCTRWSFDQCDNYPSLVRYFTKT